jgi:hypothetical protein
MLDNFLMMEKFSYYLVKARLSVLDGTSTENTFLLSPSIFQLQEYDYY